MSDGKSPFDAHRNEALGLLQEALELFQRCLDVQEFKFTQAQDDAAQEAEGQSNLARVSLGTVNGTVSNNASEEEVWASIEEPITRNTLLETAIAQLYTLTAICSLGPSDSGLVWAEQYYRNQLQDKIFIYTKGTSCQDEASFAQCKFKCAISGAAFRNGRLDLATYQKELNDAFGSPHPKLSANPQSLCDIADAELTFNASIQASVQQVQSDGMAQLSNIRWKHITKALDSLTAASKLPDAPNLPRIHLRRGDCEMLRLCLGEVPLKYDLAIKSAPILLQNAGVYYRGAAAYGRRMGDASDEQKEAEVKEAIVLSLVGNSERLSSMLKSERDVVSSIVEEMRDEGLLGQESLQTVGTSFA